MISDMKKNNLGENQGESLLSHAEENASLLEGEAFQDRKEGKEERTVTLGTDGFSEYLKAIGESKLLTRKEEQELAREIEQAMDEVGEALYHSKRARSTLIFLLEQAVQEGKFDGQLIEKGKKGRTHLSVQKLRYLIRVLKAGPRRYRRNPLHLYRVSLELLQKMFSQSKQFGLLRGEEREEMKHLDQKRDHFIASLNRLVQSNLKLVVSIAKNYYAPSMTMLDLIQEGNLGLLKAAERFDSNRGYKFSTYATWWVKQAITRARMTQARLIRLPVHLEDKLNQFKRLYRLQSQMSDREPSAESVAKKLKAPWPDIQRLMDVGREPLSLQAPVGDNEFQHFLPDESVARPEERAEASLLKRDIQEALEVLSEKERRILKLRYGLEDGIPKTLEEVGNCFQLTRERIRQIEVHSLEKLARAKRLQWLREYLQS